MITLIFGGDIKGMEWPKSKLEEFMERNPQFPWGTLNSLSEGAIEELGVVGAIQEGRRVSARRTSSGRTSSIQRKHGRKGRQAHYTRKAILEREKEAERRATWIRRHPTANESNWIRREEKRKTRKAAEREARKLRKAANA
jgi:hypothetical protein